MNDRLFGYFIISLLVLLVLIPTGLVIKERLTPSEIYTIEFDNVNSLSFLNIQDPVRIHGVQVGVIKEIDNTDNNKTIVKISSKPIILYSGYFITAHLKGLMGERYISIDPGNENSKRIEKGTVLNGTFLIGVTEILSYVSRFKAVLGKINQIVLTMKDGSTGHNSFVKDFVTFTNKFDTLSIQLTAISKSLDFSISNKRDTIDNVIRQASLIVDSLSIALPNLESDIQNILKTGNNFFRQVDTGLNNADSIITFVENVNSPLRTEELRKVQNDLKNLRAYLKELREDGLKLPIKIR
jgi:phospholipid/cholesterol/gamma-HCH transport system substrate-binding protein